MKNIYKASLSELDNVLNDIRSTSENIIDNRSLAKICTAVEEIFVNIVKHGYNNDDSKDVDIDINLDQDNREITIIFEDSALPFDPLLIVAPDMNTYMIERRIGGLGIKLVKRTMDSVHYEYKNNKNVFTIKKSY